MPYQDEIKAIKLLQGKSKDVANSHSEIASDLESIKKLLKNHTELNNPSVKMNIEKEKQKILLDMSQSKPLKTTSKSAIYEEARSVYQDRLSLGSILNLQDILECQGKYNAYVDDFNKRYALDAWDYATACSCGLFAAMLDMFFVSAPPKPTVSYTQKVDGVFNQWVQTAFNKCIPPELSKHFSLGNTIGSADVSMTAFLETEQKKVLNPYNHRLKSLSHDPILGILFGIWDMIHGTCTVVHDGKIQVFNTKRSPINDENIFRSIGRMLGHLLSDVNAPSANGNRGMGLPAPFMGILRMFEGIPVGSSNFGKQVEWMYLNGYDFRQFIVTSIPMTIMEVMLRVFYTIKQIHVHGANFGETLLDTMPLRLNPRFRMILALAYGTSSAVNAGKVYVTQNLLNANYASWMGFAWNSFHSLKWIAWDKHHKLWDGILDEEIKELQSLTIKMEDLEKKVTSLPT